jgi:precorrin-2 dehydrogenase / sirohydrochlorin ferrochelatase
MQHYVACLDLTGRSCLVVGEGAMAREKVDGLAASGATVTRVAPDAYRAEDLDHVWLVVAATSDDALNRRIYAEANERRVFCNVADVPELCSFILPALHRRGPITVAVSTAGASPALAQHLRDRFAGQVGFEHEQLANELRRIRPWVKQNFHTYEERREYFREQVAKALDPRRLDGAGQGAEAPALPALERG